MRINSTIMFILHSITLLTTFLKQFNISIKPDINYGRLLDLCTICKKKIIQACKITCLHTEILCYLIKMK